MSNPKRNKSLMLFNVPRMPNVAGSEKTERKIQ